MPHRLFKVGRYNDQESSLCADEAGEADGGRTGVGIDNDFDTIVETNELNDVGFIAVRFKGLETSLHGF